jgi:hypothetical protein
VYAEGGLWHGRRTRARQEPLTAGGLDNVRGQGRLKLEGALHDFGVSAAGRVCIDGRLHRRLYDAL